MHGDEGLPAGFGAKEPVADVAQVLAEPEEMAAQVGVVQRGGATRLELATAAERWRWWRGGFRARRAREIGRKGRGEHGGRIFIGTGGKIGSHLRNSVREKLGFIPSTPNKKEKKFDG